MHAVPTLAGADGERPRCAAEDELAGGIGRPEGTVSTHTGHELAGGVEAWPWSDSGVNGASVVGPWPGGSPAAPKPRGLPAAADVGPLRHCTLTTSTASHPLEVCRRHICARTGLTPLTSAPGLAGLTPATSAPGLCPPLPHCAGTALTPTASHRKTRTGSPHAAGPDGMGLHGELADASSSIGRAHGSHDPVATARLQPLYRNGRFIYTAAF